MSIVAAENCFRRGLAALVANRPREASELFGAAVRLERDNRVHRPRMRYLSYLGLSLAQADGATPEALRACEVAARADAFDAELLLNLGRVYVIAGKTTRALAALERGRKLAPRYEPIRRALRRIDRRRRPCVPFLDRSHPVNVALGRMRSRGLSMLGRDRLVESTRF